MSTSPQGTPAPETSSPLDRMLELQAESIRRDDQRLRDLWARKALDHKSDGAFAAFVKLMWPSVEPRRLEWAPYMSVVCHALHRQMLCDPDYRKLLILLPPGTAKSLLVSVMAPAYEWLSVPETRSLFFTGNDDLSTRDSRRTRRVLQSDDYRALLFEICRRNERKPWDFAIDQQEKRNYENTAMGFRSCLTLHSGVTGKRGDKLIVDDPMDVKAVLLGGTDAVERRCWEANAIIEQALSTRVNDPRDAQQVLVMQRLHVNDPAGHAIKDGSWRVLCLPMHYDPLHPEVSEDDSRTERGERLHPERHTDAVVAAMKKALGDQASAQLEMIPIPPSGGTYQAAWWRQYEVPPQALQVDEVCMAIDPNVKETKKGSFFCAQVWGRRWRQQNGMAAGFDRFLLDRIVGRWEHHEAKEAVKRMRWAWPTCSTIAIEDKANGPALASDLRQLFSGVVTVPRRSDRSKEVFNQVQGVPPIKAGEVYLPLPEHAPWVHDFRAQVERFPSIPNDDADTLSIMFMHWDGDRMKQETTPQQQLAGNLAALSFLE